MAVLDCMKFSSVNYKAMYGACIIGASEVKPLSFGWCETGSHGTSKPYGTAVETGWYGRRNRMVRPSKPDGTTVRRGGAYHLHVTGQPLNPRRRVLQRSLLTPQN